MTKTTFLSPHDDGFMELQTAPAVAVAHLEEVAATNIGYLVEAGVQDGETAAVRLVNLRAQEGA